MGTGAKSAYCYNVAPTFNWQLAIIVQSACTNSAASCEEHDLIGGRLSEAIVFFWRIAMSGGTVPTQRRDTRTLVLRHSPVLAGAWKRGGVARVVIGLPVSAVFFWVKETKPFSINSGTELRWLGTIERTELPGLVFAHPIYQKNATGDLQ